MVSGSYIFIYYRYLNDSQTVNIRHVYEGMKNKIVIIIKLHKGERERKF